MNPLKAIVSSIILTASLQAASDADAKNPVSAKPDNDTEINGLWHDKDGFGIWIATVARSCAEGHTSVKPLLFISPAAKPDQNAKSQNIDLRKMKMCLYFSERSPLPEKCSSGTFTYRFEKDKNQYTGGFSIQLSSGHKASQHFRAEYCKPSR